MATHSPLKIVGFAGSLRRGSLNRLFLQALAVACPPHVDFVLFRHLADLPPFNADDQHAPPAVVQKWRDLVATSQMLVITSPEYVHSIAGVTKNALDWLVADPRLPGLPVAVPDLSARTPRLGHEQLVAVLKTMQLSVIASCSPQATAAEPLIYGELTAEQNAQQPRLAQAYQGLWQEIERHASEARRG